MEDPISVNPRESAAKKKRGGRRPGAGAPRGNLNALKHGRHSQQFAALGALLASNPKIRAQLLDWGRRQDIKGQKVEDLAGYFFDRLMQHAHDIAEGKPSPGPFAGILEIKKPRRRKR